MFIGCCAVCDSLLRALFDSCVWRLLAWAAMLAMTGYGWVLRLLFGLRALASGCALFGILFSVLLGWAFRIVL